jgi:hypothetical protein
MNSSDPITIESSNKALIQPLLSARSPQALDIHLVTPSQHKYNYSSPPSHNVINNSAPAVAVALSSSANSDHGSSSSIFASPPRTPPSQQQTPSWPTSSQLKNSPYFRERMKNLTQGPGIQPASLNFNSINSTSTPGLHTFSFKLIQSTTLSHFFYQPYRAKKMLWFHSAALIFFAITPILVYLMGRYVWNYTVRVAYGHTTTTPLGLQAYWAIYLSLYGLYMAAVIYQAYFRRLMFPFKARPFILLLISALAGFALMIYTLFRTIFNVNISCIFSRIAVDLFFPSLAYPFIFRAIQLALLFTSYPLNHRRATLLFLISLLPWITFAIFTQFNADYADFDTFSCTNHVYQSERSGILLVSCDGFLSLGFAGCLWVTRRVWDQFQIKSELFVAFLTQIAILTLNIVASWSNSVQITTDLIITPIFIVRSVLLFYISFSLPLYQSFALIQSVNMGENDSTHVEKQPTKGQTNAKSSLSESQGEAFNPLASNSGVLSRQISNSMNSSNFHQFLSNSSSVPRPAPLPAASSQHNLLLVISNLSYFDYFRDYMCCAESLNSATLWEFYISCVLFGDSEESYERLSIGNYILSEFFSEATFAGATEFSQWLFLIIHRVYSPEKLSAEQNFARISSNLSHSSAFQGEKLDHNDTLRLFEADFNDLLSIFYQSGAEIEGQQGEFAVENGIFMKWQEGAFEVMNHWCWNGFLQSNQYKKMIKFIQNQQKITETLHQAAII